MPLAGSRQRAEHQGRQRITKRTSFELDSKAKSPGVWMAEGGDGTVELGAATTRGGISGRLLLRLGKHADGGAEFDRRVVGSPEERVDVDGSA